MRYKHSWSSLNWPLGWKILQHLWMHLHLDYQLKTVFWCISHISCSPKLWLCLCLCFVFAFSPSGFICFILYFLCCCVNECILLSLFRVRVSVFVFVFCPCLCICYFLMSNKNVSRLVLSPDSLPTAFAFFFICPLFLSVSLVLILCLYHVRQCRCFLVSPEGHEACFSVAVFVFFLMCLCLFLLLSLALFAVSVFVIIFDVKWECSQTGPPPRGSRSLAPSAPFLLNIQINFLLSLLFLVKIFLSIFY